MFKAILFDPFLGISGDMTLGALIDLGVDPGEIQRNIEKLGINSLKLETEDVIKSGIRAKKIRFKTDEEKQAKRTFKQIKNIIQSSRLAPKVKENSIKAFKYLGEVEARIHGKDLEEVHFHEIGALDTIGDICGTFIALDILGVDKIFTRPITLGSGFIKFSHGTFPVPAPATIELLKGFDVSYSELKGELTTPTGAAILKTIASPFPDELNFIPLKIGYGAGERDYEDFPNVLRVSLIQMEEVSPYVERDTVWELSVNIDDMTGEEGGILIDQIIKKGALDAWITQVIMKKSRPAFVFNVLCPENKLDIIEKEIFLNTRTLGIRKHKVFRSKLIRESKIVDTPYGKVRIKIRSLPSGKKDFSIEYEDARSIAEKENISLIEAYKKISDHLKNLF